MATFEISSDTPGRCKIRHLRANAEIITDLPPEFGGQGRSFSSTDLVTAALGSCFLTSIDTIIEDWGYDLEKLKISVQKHLAVRPNCIRKVEVEISYAGESNRLMEQEIIEAVADCPVRRSLSDGIDVEVAISAY